MHIPTLIARKREGEELSKEEIGCLIEGYVSGVVADYQMSAFAMAVFFKGMTAVETAALTNAMIASGDVFSHPKGAVVVDKHSTGGIGDKVSLILAPLVACAGCRVPMVSGRGLGITGGTLDKLESIPGFRVGVSMDEAGQILDKLGVVMMGQTDRFCPADKKLYALRDVTGTVPSIALITASIMSKKMAETLDRLVLDVKYGTGAFMKTREDAETLAEGMRAVGKEMGVEVFALLNEMSEPTGRTVGNVLEVIEALECLDGGGPADLREVVLDLSEKIAGVSRSELEALIDDGSARRKFEELVAMQGGDPADLPRLSEIHKAPVIREVISENGGTVIGVDAGKIGQASLELGAGRSRAEDAVDFAVGFDCLVKSGEELEAGGTLVRIHARSVEAAVAAEVKVRAAISVS
ncbi:MAG: thymidine phosphorylase [Akkermansiaceae bacterium]|jgi:pyrimidine-nucleoside phosphorylase|nr:thymidine phosphorylase [Akkermansiaceae bacterium]MDP4647764.1 thymidine phosphorylase [Akkermansiaceae bacterium]MDP4781482.1 thymidine phosphorylase [Akkermansiaceae bacterium]MDP4899031.1 thymidine phosphorylase [Akkermansiaceae bacterium]MDP4997048.1 thymidine phosphorylase [Akkermansiaceae bacterium]